MRERKRGASLLSAVAVLLVTLLLSVVGATAALADDASVATPVSQGARPDLTLASTGLDITVPVIIGLSTLVVGMALVCWAFLRGPRSRRR
jgi:amino acid transporter